MNKRKRQRSGIRLYTQKGNSSIVKEGGEGILRFPVQILAIGFLAVAWWNSFISVFPINTDQRQVSGFLFIFSVLAVLWMSMTVKKRALSMLSCVVLVAVLFWKKKGLAVVAVNYLVNAYLRIHYKGSVPLMVYEEPAVAGWIAALMVALVLVPFVLVWTYVFLRNRGKWLAVLLIIFPAVLAVVEGYFLSISSFWFLIFCTGFYFAASGSATGKAAMSSGVAAIACLFALFLLSSVAVKPMENAKVMEEGLYRKARLAVNEKVVKRLADMAGKTDDEEQKSNQDNKQQETENEDDDKKVDEAGDDGLPETTGQYTGIITEGPNGDGPVVFQAGGTKDLKSIASFSPNAGSGLTVVVKSRPTGIFYYPEEYGGNYDGNSWEPKPVGDELYAEYSQYPDNLTRLIAFCKKQNVKTVEDAARLIQQEFENNTVYDYHPGTTPAEQDFAEYFLFENQKGFCVHFATTATLMYRIWGFPARYARGYAIPSSAFQETANGTYEAEVTPEMGHAWCEIYEDGWKIKEHTLPYLGDEPEAAVPAVDSSQNAPEEMKISEKILRAVLGFALILGLGAIIFLIQAVIRRKQKGNKCRKYKQGRGILATYQTIFDIAVFLGMRATEPAGVETFGLLKEMIPEISPEEWEWMQEIIWRTMFGKKIPTKEEHEKMYFICQRAAQKIGSRLKGWKKIKYYNINCFSS